MKFRIRKWTPAVAVIACRVVVVALLLTPRRADPTTSSNVEPAQYRGVRPMAWSCRSRRPDREATWRSSRRAATPWTRRSPPGSPWSPPIRRRAISAAAVASSSHRPWRTAGEPVVFDYRETAPAISTRTMFDKTDARYGHKVAATPGTVRGFALALSAARQVAVGRPARAGDRLAKEGFPIDANLATSLNDYLASTPR